MYYFLSSAFAASTPVCAFSRFANHLTAKILPMAF
jgi:hypothetical protein